LNLIYQAQEEWDKAIQLYQENIERDSSDIENWLEIAEIYRQKNDTLNAITTLEEAKTMFPDDWRSYLDLGRILMDGQIFERALKEFNKVIELEPKSFFGWLFAGISLVHMDSLERSKSYLHKSLDIEPRDRLGNYYLGSVYAQQNLNAEAVPFLENALLEDPGWMAALIPLAGAYESLKEYALSDSLFQKALSLEPNNDLVLNNYAYSLSERGERLFEAEKMAKKALEINPDNGAYLDTMGWIYYKQGKYQKALGFIEKSFSQRKSGIVAGHLGDVYEKLNLMNKAREYWETALELDQNQPEIQRKLNRLAEEQF
jgi:tetratricopeptide (TPR) repeat protein